MRVLFMCVANSARSQMAEGLARGLLNEKVEIQSAGSFPSHVHPLAVRALEKRGMNTEGQRSKSIQTIDPETVDIVITLCQEEVCPTVFGEKKRLRWPMPDPSRGARNEEEALEQFCQIRDEIEKKIREEFGDYLS